MSFITVSRNSEEGQKLLWGKDPANRYIPIRGENLGQGSETVTFQVVPRAAIKVPGFGTLAGELFKWRKLIFILFPFVRWLVSEPKIELGIFSLLVISSLFLFWGVSWQADVLDHMKGYDLETDSSDKKLLSKGWIPAGFLHTASWVMIFLAAVAGGMVLLVRPPLTAVAIITATLLFFLFFAKGRAYKKRGVFDFGLLVITGPLFTASIQYALFGVVTGSEILFGVIWGMLFLFSQAVQSFPKAVQLAQRGIEPWLFLRDFDKNKKYFPLFWLFILSLYFVYEVINYRMVLAALDLVIVLFFTYRWSKTLSNLKSPLSSEMKKATEEGHQLVLLFIFLWFMELVYAEFIKVLARFI